MFERLQKFDIFAKLTSRELGSTVKKLRDSGCGPLMMIARPAMTIVKGKETDNWRKPYKRDPGASRRVELCIACGRESGLKQTSLRKVTLLTLRHVVVVARQKGQDREMANNQRLDRFNEALNKFLELLDERAT